ncbi:MAG: glycosyltransferase family 39 protein [Planctomycetes bacterium]|nr:glycosyltransferase family 39 protein [Planctomycetota bacterium]
MTSEDEALYVLLSRALLSGQGYVSTWLPDSPRHVLVPPGYPWLLSIAQSVFGEGLGTIRGMTIACTGISAALAYLLAWILLSRQAAIACTFLLLASPLLWRFSGSLLAEAPAQVLVLGSLAAGEAARGSRAWHRWFILGVALCLAAIAVRAASLPLLGAWILLAAFPREARSRSARAISAGTCAITLCLLATVWLVWRAHGGPNLHGDYLRNLSARDPLDLDQSTAGARDLLDRGVRGTAYLAHEATDALFHHLAKLGPLESAGRMALLFLLACGGVALWRRGRMLTLAWTALYSLELSLFPAYEGGRYAYPLLPLVAVLLWAGVEVCCAHTRHLRLGPPLVFALAILSAARVTLWLPNAGGTRIEPAMARYLEVADRIRAQSPPGTIVVCRKPCVLALRSDLGAVLYPYTRDPRRLAELVERIRARWIVADELSPTTEQFLLPALPSLPIEAAPRFEIGRTRAWRVK